MKVSAVLKFSMVALCTLLGACANNTAQKAKQTPTDVINQADQLVRLGERTEEGGDLANAIGFYQRAYSLTPDNQNILTTLADAMARAGDLRAEEQLYRNALIKTPDNIELLRRHANTLIKLDRIAQARIQLEKALNLAPEDSKLNNSMGVALDLQGHHEQAQAHYKKVNGLSGVNNLALSLALQGKYDQALALLSPYESDLTLPARYRLNLALIHGLKGDEDAAARVAGYILDREAVEHNLEVYRTLRNMSALERAQQILSGPKKN